MTFTCSRRTLLAGALATAAGAALPGRSNAAWAPDLPPLSDPDWWWGIFRDLTLMGLGSLPGIGGVASYFGALFLPQSLFTRPDEQWQRYVQAINTIVDARIADAIYLQVSARLQGISQALRLYQQAQTLIQQQALWVPLAHPTAATLLRQGVEGYQVSPFGRLDFSKVTVTK